MTLSREIAAALEHHARTAPGAPATVEAATDDHRMALLGASGGPVGVAFDELTFAAEGSGSSPLAGAELRAWGDRLVARLTYLMEPLVVLEVDEDAGLANLRSQAPTARGDVRSFYEVRLGRDRSLRLGRVRFDAATRRREAMPCQLTGEVVERLADDLVASLA